VQSRSWRDRPIWRALLHPLTAICCLQAALSLTLIRSNTAFVDEADYLWLGRLLVAHWLHGTTWPAGYGDQAISGSPYLYPPLGAAADMIGGLAGARILSLAFMLAATVLLYFTAARLFGRRSATFAAVIWAVTEPVLRLAFATYDPLSVLLTALSAWLVVQAGFRRRHGEFVTLAAVALALANAASYAGIVIDPVVIAFAFVVWVPRFGIRQAAYSAAWLFAGLVVFLSFTLTISHSWSGIRSWVINPNLGANQHMIVASGIGHNVAVQQSYAVVLNAIWGYSGFVMVLALVGAITGIASGRRQLAALLVLLGGTAFVIPAAAQFNNQIVISLDKHLAFGLWFAAMAAGYGVSKLVTRLPGASRKALVLLCSLALLYPALAGWQSARQAFLGWTNTQSFIAEFKPILAHSHGLIYAAGEQHVAQYYTPQGADWQRWNTHGMPLNPVGVPRSEWTAYYQARLRDEDYGVIALFYSTGFSSVQLPASMLLFRSPQNVYEHLLGLVGDASGEPGLPALTQALQHDPAYRPVAVGRFDSAHTSGLYVIWQKRAPA